MMKIVNAIITTFILVCLYLGLAVYSFTRNVWLSIAVSLGIFAGMIVIYYVVYAFWYKPVHKMSKEKKYWIPKLFILYIINGGFVAYHYTQYREKITGLVLLYALGVVGLVYELVMHAKTNRSVIDMFGHSTRDLYEQTGHSYWDFGLVVLVLAASLISLAYLDGVLLLGWLIERTGWAMSLLT